MHLKQAEHINPLSHIFLISFFCTCCVKSIRNWNSGTAYLSLSRQASSKYTISENNFKTIVKCCPLKQTKPRGNCNHHLENIRLQTGDVQPGHLKHPVFNVLNFRSLVKCMLKAKIKNGQHFWRPTFDDKKLCLWAWNYIFTLIILKIQFLLGWAMISNIVD